MLLKLAPSPEQHTALLETMHALNDACHMIAEVTYENQLANTFTLQKLSYLSARTKYIATVKRIGIERWFPLVFSGSGQTLPLTAG